MTFKQKSILVGLDAISIILSIIEILLTLIVMNFSKNDNITYLFIFMGFISALLLYSSIINIIDGEK